MQLIRRVTDSQAQRLFSDLTGKGARLVRMGEQYQPEAWQTVSGSDYMQILREPSDPLKAIARTKEKDYRITLKK